jgi:signal transduction histidine kinase
LGVLELALLHCNVLEEKLPPSLPREEASRRRRAAVEFFLESLAPHEMAYRGYQEANFSLRQLNELLEEQARTIAHAIHDEAGQLLIAVNLALGELAIEVPSRLRSRFAEVATLLGQIEKDLRNFSHELRPTMLDDLGLVPALEFLTGKVSQRTDLTVRLDSHLHDRLPANLEIILYRVVQEALANAAKHSKARSVNIHLAQENSAVCCSVRDDGIGFDAAGVHGRTGRRGLGLIGMKERLHLVGGVLQVKSVIGQGTELLISIPLEVSHASSGISRG